MRVVELLLSAAAAHAARENVCFIAHAKTALQCAQSIVDGPIQVYDDSEVRERWACPEVRLT